MPSYIVFFPHYVLIASYKPKRLRPSSAYALIARLFQACIYVHFYLLMRSGLRTPFKCYLYYICLCHLYKFFKIWLIKKIGINQLVIYITSSKYDKKMCYQHMKKTLTAHSANYFQQDDIKVLWMEICSYSFWIYINLQTLHFKPSTWLPTFSKMTLKCFEWRFAAILFGFR